jgi:hypothetical protein
LTMKVGLYLVIDTSRLLASKRSVPIGPGRRETIPDTGASSASVLSALLG